MCPLGLGGRGGSAGYPRDAALEAASRVLDDLDGEHLGRGHLLVQELHDAAALVRDPVRREHQADGQPRGDHGSEVGTDRNGIRDLFPDATLYASSVELGTASDEEQLIATYQDQWVHRRGLREHPDHASVVWAYRCCFTPDDRTWEHDALAAGGRQLAAAVRAVAEWI